MPHLQHSLLICLEYLLALLQWEGFGAEAAKKKYVPLAQYEHFHFHGSIYMRLANGVTLDRPRSRVQDMVGGVSRQLQQIVIQDNEQQMTTSYVLLVNCKYS